MTAHIRHRFNPNLPVSPMLMLINSATEGVSEYSTKIQMRHLPLKIQIKEKQFQV